MLLNVHHVRHELGRKIILVGIARNDEYRHINVLIYPERKMKFFYFILAVAGISLAGCSRGDTAPLKSTPTAPNAAVGSIVIEPQFSDVEPFAGGFARVKVGEKSAALVGYIDRKGKLKVNPKYRYAGDFAEGLAPVDVSVDGEWSKWGYIDAEGRTIIEPQFGNGEAFEDGYAVVAVGNPITGPRGLIDKRGQFVVNPIYADLYRISKNRYSYRPNLDSRAGILDSSGKTIAEPQFNSLGVLAEGVAPAAFGKEGDKNGERCGYVDAEGKIVIEPQFLQCKKFSGGLARVGAIVDGVGGWGFIDHKGKFVIKPQFNAAENFHDGLAAVAVGSLEENAKWGFIDRTGAVVIAPQFDEVGFFENGRAVVRVGGGFGSQQRSEMRNALDQTKPVKAGKWGVIDKQGRFSVNPRFDRLEAPTDGLAPMRIGDHITGKWGYIAL